MKLYSSRILYFSLLVSPLFNAISDATINFFDSQENSFHLGLLRGIYLILIIVLFYLKFGLIREKSSLAIFGFVTYLLILLPFSSNIIYSFSSGYIKWFGSLLLFPMGVFFFREKNQINSLSWILILSMVPITINFLLAQYYKLGVSSYIEDSYYYGGANIGITNTLSFLVLSTPIYFAFNRNEKKWKRLIVITLIFLSVFSIIMVMKRSAIMGLVLGTVTYLIFTPYKGYLIKFLALTSLLVLLTLPFFWDQLERKIDARTGERNNIENEARYHETFFVIDEFRNGGIRQKLIGTEPFNSKQFFGPKYFNRERMIHGDLSAFLYGMGIIGLLWYVTIFYKIGSKNIKFLKYFSHTKIERELIAVVFAFLATGFIITITGTGTIGERGTMYLTMGALFGYLRNQIRINRRTLEIQ